MPQDLASQKQFIDFLIYVAEQGYASDTAQIDRLDDGSRDLVLEQNGFRFHDNWFGGEPFGGREVVSKAGQVLWMAVYYGSFTADIEVGTKVLRAAMRKPDAELPVRGPKTYTENGYRYTYEWTGNINRFKSVEKIYQPSGTQIYQAEISGGLVDQ